MPKDRLKGNTCRKQQIKPRLTLYFKGPAFVCVWDHSACLAEGKNGRINACGYKDFPRQAATVAQGSPLGPARLRSRGSGSPGCPVAPGAPTLALCPGRPGAGRGGTAAFFSLRIPQRRHQRPERCALCFVWSLTLNMWFRRPKHRHLLTYSVQLRP